MKSVPELKGAELGWKEPKPFGGVLKPIGKSTYLTSVLQCLAYIPPLASLLASGSHAETCEFVPHPPSPLLFSYV